MVMKAIPQEIKHEDIQRLIEDVEMLKDIVLSNSNMEDPEGELTDWAKEQLRIARATPLSEYISLEEVEKKIRSRK